MKKRQFIYALQMIGLQILEQQGFIIIHSTGGSTFIRSLWYYPWWYIKAWCYANQDFFKGQWERAYEAIKIANHKSK